MNKSKRKGRKEKVKTQSKTRARTSIKTKAKPKPRAKVQPGGLRRVSQYLKEVRLELKKVAWPSRQEITISTIVVIIAVLLFAIYVGLLDIGFSTFVKFISALFQS